MEHTKHIWRAVLLLLVLAVIGVFGRHFLIPESFGEAGGYRYDSIYEFMALPAVHGEAGLCETCHADQASAKLEGKHAGLNCQTCHSPTPGLVERHTEAYMDAPDGEGVDESAAMPVNQSHRMCMNCHQQLEGRPEFMPQIDAREHLTVLEVLSPEEEIQEGTCTACHLSHNPTI